MFLVVCLSLTSVQFVPNCEDADTVVALLRKKGVRIVCVYARASD
jgi:hypothetical protein